MKPTMRAVLLGGAALFMALPALAELDVESYIDLTIARLELIEQSWRENDEPPSEEQLAELYESYGTDQEAYLCFAGEHKRQVEEYLRKHEDLRDVIESLAAAISREISEGSEE